MRLCHPAGGLSRSLAQRMLVVIRKTNTTNESIQMVHKGVVAQRPTGPPVAPQVSCPARSGICRMCPFTRLGRKMDHNDKNVYRSEP